MTDSTDERLRTHPEDRFAGRQHLLDLNEIAKALSGEPGDTQRGHRQETIYKHGPVTVALFLFDKGGQLREHVAHGVVTVHVVEGRLKMTADQTAHVLTAGQMLVMAPGVPHDLLAEESTRMLLTVCLDESKTT